MEIITHTRAGREYAIAVPQAVINTGREQIMPHVEAAIDAQHDAFINESVSDAGGVVDDTTSED